MTHKISRPLRWLALAALLSLALGLAACGNSDSDADGGGGSAQSEAGDGGSSAGGNDEEQISAALEDVQAAFISGDGKVACGLLTKPAQDELKLFGTTKDMACVPAVAELARLGRESRVEQKPARVVSVKLNGDKATAKVKDANRPPYNMIFAKESGQWKLTTIGFGGGGG